MTKIVINTVADVITSNKASSTVRFIDEPKAVKDKSKEPEQRMAKTVVQIAFNTSNATEQLRANRKYRITIEEIN